MNPFESLIYGPRNRAKDEIFGHPDRDFTSTEAARLARMNRVNILNGDDPFSENIAESTANGGVEILAKIFLGGSHSPLSGL